MDVKVPDFLLINLEVAKAKATWLGVGLCVHVFKYRVAYDYRLIVPLGNVIYVKYTIDPFIKNAT